MSGRHSTTALSGSREGVGTRGGIDELAQAVVEDGELCTDGVLLVLQRVIQERKSCGQDSGRLRRRAQAVIAKA